MSAVSTLSTTGSSPSLRLSGGSNFIGTLTLAACVLGITASVYFVNWRGVQGSGDNRRPGVFGDGDANGSSGSATRDAASSAAAAAAPGSASPRPPVLPLRNYYSVCAELHIKRHNAKLLEWCDDHLGIQITYSPLFFELKQEERQAPLVLLSFRNLRQETHRLAVTIEELCAEQSTESYRDASLANIAEYAKVLASTTIRIGNVYHPQAELCYLDEMGRMNHVLSVFLVHERWAVTVQYIAPNPVKDLLPTAFFELVRSIRFNAPRPTPSYLLVSEPRLGLGYRLPLDFIIHEGLAESDGNGERLLTSATPYQGRPEAAEVCGGETVQQTLPRYRGGGAPIDVHGTASEEWCHTATPSLAGETAAMSVPYATMMSRGTRRMGLITSYEPQLGQSSAASFLARTVGDAEGLSSATTGVTMPARAWQLLLEQQLSSAVRRWGLCVGEDGLHQIVYRTGTEGERSRREASGAVVVRPYRLRVPTKGNFNSVDYDGGEESVLKMVGMFLLQEASMDANSPCLPFVYDALDEEAQGDGANVPRVRVYWSAVYLPVGTTWVSFHFFASALRHSLEEFAAFCTTVMDTISLGNHYGQSVSVLYTNVRHDALPFCFGIPAMGMTTVEEPMLGDPLCLVHTYGIERMSVLVRIFPLILAQVNVPVPPVEGTTAADPSISSTPERRGSTPPPPPGRQRQRHGKSRYSSAARMLEYLVRHYLQHLPSGAKVEEWERLTINSKPALRICFQPLAGRGGSSDGGLIGLMDELDGSSAAGSEWLATRAVALEEEVGERNPFAQYFAPPPPPSSYVGLKEPRQPVGSGAAGTAASTAVTTATVTPVSSVMMSGGALGGDRRIGAPSDLYFYARGSASLNSQEGTDEPLRVAIVVCCDSHAFLLQTTASAYTLGAAYKTVYDLAAQLSVLTPP